jgi:predicted PhzF superfamily epimerase YddE/YHI9
MCDKVGTDRSVDVTVLRVFTDANGAFGNALGLVRSAAVPPDRRQQVAAQLPFSDTVFVDMPAPGSSSARVHIFSPADETPFAGAPAVGASWWLRAQGVPVHTLLVPAGVVEVEYDGDSAAVRVPSEWAPEFAIHDLGSPQEVVQADAADFADGFPHYLWAWVDRPAGCVRARVFAPEVGVYEDEATGAAAIRLTDYLGRDLTIVQGRGSVIRTTWSTSGWVQVAGTVADGGVLPLC